MADQAGGNGANEPQSRVTKLEIDLAVLREQVRVLQTQLESHVYDARKANEEDELHAWQGAVDDELGQIAKRHDAEDTTRDVSKSFLEREWRTVLFLASLIGSVASLLRELKVI